MGLEAADWTVVAKNSLVLARIDHEEPYWAEKAAQQLTADGITVEIPPAPGRVVRHAPSGRPQLGFSLARRRTSTRIEPTVLGRPPRLGRDRAACRRAIRPAQERVWPDQQSHPA
ncbi:MULTISPECIES: hypothetical protein [unclassified Streptomyces]|uniref:hypothetical protein n=1 Tax=unclassified Streptomyces TaxID=2593676 RepID=UPI0035DB5A99